MNRRVGILNYELKRRRAKIRADVCSIIAEAFDEATKTGR